MPLNPARRSSSTHRFPVDIALETLPLRPRICYTRKSSEAKEAQVRSHEQQLDTIRSKYSDTEFLKHFRDDRSGKTFEDRPGFEAMLAWCQRHPQPRSARGTIVMFDKSRFGRALVPGTDETDWDAYDEARLAFARAGWELEFVAKQKTGDALVDRILSDLDDEQSSEYVRRLARNVTRGQNDAFKDGYWGRGLVPFPCVRVEARTGRVLADAQRDERGAVVRDADGRAVLPSERVQQGARILLAGDPERVKHWEHGARLLLERRPWRDVIRYFDEHVRTNRGTSRWTRKTLKKVYSNRALIGVIERTIGGQALTIPAKWAPVVDPELFGRVQTELWRRQQAEPQCRDRRADSDYIIRNMRCAHCGVRYTGNVRKSSHSGEGKRYYNHPEVDADAYMDRETRARAEAAGCRTYRVPADMAEHALYELILRERCQPGFAESMVRLLNEGASHRAEAERLVAAERERVARVTGERDAVLLALDKATPATVDLLMERVEAKNLDVLAAQRDLQAAEERLAASNGAVMDATAHLQETIRIARTWESADPDARQRIIDWWVRSVVVTVEQVPGKKRGTVLQKTLHVVLATSPDEEPYSAVLPAFSRGAEPNESVPVLAIGYGEHGEPALRLVSDTSSRRSPPSGRRGSRPGGAT